jgi:hypothetical protein
MPERTLEDAIRAMLDAAAPRAVPESLQHRAAAIPQTVPPAARSSARWPLRALTGLAAVLVMAMIVGLGFAFRAGVGDHPTPTPPTATAPGSATPSTSPSPVTGLPAGVLGAPGSIVVANVDKDARGEWQLHLQVVSADVATVETGTYPFLVPDSWRPARVPRVVISADGWAAIALEATDDQATDGSAVMVLDLVGDGGSSGAIVGSGPSWLPDGTLLLSERVMINKAYREVARRIPDHGFGGPTDLVIGQQPPAWTSGYPALPAFPGYYLVEADGSGLRGYVFRGNTQPEQPITVRWDGTVVRRDAADPPLLTFGTERTAGAHGEAVIGCADGSCPRQWQRPDGRLVALPFHIGTSAWTRPGDALIALDGTRVGRITDTSGGPAWTPLAELPAASFEGDTVSLTGMSDWAAVLESDAGHAIVIPLDGSEIIGPLDGTLAAVVP